MLQIRRYNDGAGRYGEWSNVGGSDQPENDNDYVRAIRLLLEKALWQKVTLHENGDKYQWRSTDNVQ